MRTVRFPSPQHFFSANSQMHHADRPKKCGALRFYHHVFLLPLKKDFVPVRAKVLFLIPQASGNQLRLNALFYFVRYDRRSSGASRGIRTLDTWFRRPVLYPLSYRRLTSVIIAYGEKIRKGKRCLAFARQEDTKQIPLSSSAESFKTIFLQILSGCASGRT